MSFVTVRAATLADADQLFVLVQMFPTPTPPTSEAFMSVLRAKLASANAYVALAVMDGRIVGYVAGYRHAAFYAGGETAWVDEVLVLDELRRQGVGERLMASFEEWAAQHRCVLVGLATAGAKAFYEHLGYSTKAGYYKKYLGHSRT